MRKKVYIGIDIGASSGRLYAGWIEDDRLQMEEIHRFVTDDVFLVDRRVRNIYRYYDEILAGLKRYVKNNDVEIVSIGADAMGSDFGIIDSQGNLIMQPISYRGVDLEDQIGTYVEETYGRWKIYENCGNQEMPCDTLHQIIRLVRNEENAVKYGDKMLFIADLIHYLLCGAVVAEHSLAGYGRLFSQRTDSWEDSIFDAFGIPGRLQPKISHSGDIIGKLHREICEDIGIDDQPDIVTPCTHDTSCAAFAVPDLGEDYIFISSGSWSLLGIETEKPVLTEEAWHMNASNSSMPIRANMFKRIITGMWIMQRLQKQWDNIEFGTMVSEAEKVTDNHWYIDPDAQDFYQPRNMAEAICTYLKRVYGEAPDENDVGHLTRIFVESLAMKYRYFTDRLLHAAGVSRSSVYIVGGGSANGLLNQMTANILQRPVKTGIKEASAAGNILCQMYGKGELADRREAKELLIRTFPVTVYEPDPSPVWEEKYQQFLQDTGLATQ